jgi:membrane protein
MRMKASKSWGLLKKTFREWLDDNAPTQAAALAYYAAFSMAPLLIIAIAVASIVFDRATVQQFIVQQIQGLAGQQGAELITSMLSEDNKSSTNILAAVIGIVVLLFGASGVFGQLQESLNAMWDVKPKAAGFLGVIKHRFFSFTMVVCVGFLLLITLFVSAALVAFGTWTSNLLPGAEALMMVLNFVISFAVVTALFALVFKYVPDAEIRWHDVWLGAAFTAALFTIGKSLIGLYLGKASVASKFGAAGSLVIILLWVYYSGLISFLGAEFTQVYANTFGSKVVPDKHAEPATEEARKRQDEQKGRPD